MQDKIEPTASEQAAWHAGLNKGRAQKSCLMQIQEPAVNQQLTTEQQPVAGQCRFKEREWGACHPKHVAMVLFSPHEWPDYEVRYLYAAPVLAAQPDSLQALRALHDSVELAMQRGALSERALEIIILQPATDVLMRSAVIVPDHIHSTEANSLYGESYGVDWVYEGKKAAQPEGSVSNATLEAAPAAVAVPDEREALQAFVKFAEGRIEELGMLSPEMQVVLDMARVALAATPAAFEQLRVNPESEPVAKYVYGEKTALLDVVALSVALESAKKQIAATPAADAPTGMLKKSAITIGDLIFRAQLLLSPGSKDAPETLGYIEDVRGFFYLLAKNCGGMSNEVIEASAEDWMTEEGKAEAKVFLEAVFLDRAKSAETAAAPVVLPEPVGWIDKSALEWIGSRERGTDAYVTAYLHKSQCAEAGDSIFTEPQVRALLAEVSAPAAQAVEQAPVLYVSKGQLAKHRDPDGPDSTEHGRYLPARVTPAGKFITPLFAAPQAQADALYCADCGCPETSWCSCPDSPMNPKPGTKERTAAIAAAKGE